LFLGVCLILILQAAATHALSITEQNRPLPELYRVPTQLAKWNAAGEQRLDTTVAEALKPDDYILRNYVDPSAGVSVNLFVGYFRSLQNSYGPHSPRVCLPGSGWLIEWSNTSSVAVPGEAHGIPVNEYVMEKANERIVVVYWYQNDRDAWAEEYHAKLKLLPDLIRYRRSDVGLIRLVAPIGGDGPQATLAHCLDFTRLVFPVVAERFAATNHEPSDSAYVRRAVAAKTP